MKPENENAQCVCGAVRQDLISSQCFCIHADLKDSVFICWNCVWEGLHGGKKDLLVESISLLRWDQGKRWVATSRLHLREVWIDQSSWLKLELHSRFCLIQRNGRVGNGIRRGTLLQLPLWTSIKSLMNGVSPRAVNLQPEGIVRRFHLLSPPDDRILCSGRYNPGLLFHGFLTESVLTSCPTPFSAFLSISSCFHAGHRGWNFTFLLSSC